MKRSLALVSAICILALAIMAAFGSLTVQARTAPTCAELDGSVVYSDQDDPAYLGFFGVASATNSIMNRSGPHGDSVSAYSVRSTTSIYGNTWDKFSINNIYGRRPPIIVKRAKIIGRLTANTLIDGGVTLGSIDLNCTFTALKHDTSRPLPGPVPWFTASDGDFTDKVLLNWGDAPGAGAYVVTVSGGNLQYPFLLPEANYTSLEIVGLTAGVKYQFGVRAINLAGPGSYRYDTGYIGGQGAGTPTNTPAMNLGQTPVGSPIPTEIDIPDGTPDSTPDSTPDGTPGVPPDSTLTPFPAGTPTPWPTDWLSTPHVYLPITKN
jgi:hypothetical protein